MFLLCARSWWALALRGFFAMLFGVAAFLWPGMTLQVLVLLYGAFALANGVFSLIAAFAGWGWDRRWGAALLLEGIAGIAVGVLTFAWPGITALVLLYLIAAWAVLTGIFEVVAAVRLRSAIRGEWLLALSGILSVVLGVALVMAPQTGALAVVWLIGTYAFLYGGLLLALALRLRSLSHEVGAMVA